MHCLDELPNELLLIIFSYLSKSELIESFFQLSKRLNNLLLKYISHVYLSSILTKGQFNEFLKISSMISSLTIENYQIGKNFIDKFNGIQLENFHRIKILDCGIDLYQEILRKFQPEVLNIVITSLNHEGKPYQIESTSLKQLEIEFQIGEYAKSYLLNQFNSLSPSILVHVRLTFPKLSEYFQLFDCQYSLHISKLNISIFSIDKTDYSQSSIVLPDLVDFQLEICEIPFYLIRHLLPSTNSLKRFGFIGQTTSINALSWKVLLHKYNNSIQRFDLHLSNVKHFQYSDTYEWKREFPMYSIDYNSSSNIFRIHSSKFDQLERFFLNESIENLTHIDYGYKINHLIIRSQYWCSYFDLSLNIRNDLCQRFDHIKRLTTTYRQLDYFLSTKFLNQIEQIDLEFSEQYCFIKYEIAEQLIHLKSLVLSSIYDGTHQIELHSTIKDLLLNKFSKIVYLYIDAIQIIDDEQVENSIDQWYSCQINQPMINYTQGKSLSIWF